MEACMANEGMGMSANGRSELRRREKAVFHYYNDAANNCTYGIGALAHYGPCTEEELNRPVTPNDVDTQLVARVSEAERAVRRGVAHTTLTQEQFDALVSFTFNTGARGAAATLSAANRGAMAEVATHMSRNVYVHPRDANGQKLPAVRLQGLVTRRRDEAAPFQQPSTGNAR